MRKQYLECGKIVSTHGVRGEVRVQPWCDSPEFLLQFPRLYMQNGETPLEVEGARTHKNMVLLKLKGFDTLDEAAALRGRVLYINRNDAPDDGGFFIQDLLGLEAIDADTGRSWGVLEDVLETGANDVYVFRDGEAQRLVPVIPGVVIDTDIQSGIIKIRPLKGLFDDAD